MTLAWILLFVVAFVGVYWFGLRPWLRSMPSLADEWEMIDAWEARLWSKSRTILSAKLMWIPSTLVGIHDFIAMQAIDWTPITTKIASFIPAPYGPVIVPFLVAMIARFFQYMRTITVESVEEKKGS